MCSPEGHSRDSFSLNLDLLFWLAWLAIELMGFCRYSTSAEVIEVCCHTCLWCECGGGGGIPKLWPQALAVGLYSLNYLPSCVLGSVTVTGERLFNWTLDGRAPFLSYTFTLLVLLSFLTMNLCESPPKTCYSKFLAPTELWVKPL